MTSRLATPRRRLIYELASVETLTKDMAQSLDLRQALQHPKRLVNPTLLTIHLFGNGSHDISSANYDMGNPLVLDTGTPLVKLAIPPSCEPPSIRPPLVTVDGTKLKIGPSLIYRKHRLTYTVLAERPPGKKPKLRCQSSLIDVVVRRGSHDIDRSPNRQGPIFLTAATSLFQIIGANLPALRTTVAQLIIVLVAVIVAASAGIWYARRRGQSN